MIAEVRGIACSFNSTVYEENLKYLPGMLEWAREHIDIVHTMVFICFRHVIPDMPFDWFAGGEKVDWDKIWYHSNESREIEIGSPTVVAAARQHDPEFQPAAYLNGTADPSALKWMLTERIGNRRTTYGYVGPKFIEILMSAYHLQKGRYLSYVAPSAMARGRTAMFLLWPFDRGVRRAFGRYLKSILVNPLRIFRRAYLQSIMCIQPVDCMADGSQSMCDGCPDITVHEGKLVWSCRLEELKQFGTILTTAPKKQEPEPAEAPVATGEDAIGTSR
jgi:hypothetical protein